MKRNKIITILTCLVIFCMAAGSLQAQNVLNQARIYIDAGHGGWGSNDRPLPVIGFTIPRDTMAFFESRSNLIKALSLRDELQRAGAGYVRMNRTVNGIAPLGETASPGALVPEILHGTVVDGQAQIINLSVIARDVEENNIDYFLSIHSDASTEGAIVNHLVLLFRGTDDQVGNGLRYARDMARASWRWLFDNGMTVFMAHNLPTSNNTRGDISFMGGSSTTTPIPGGTAYTGFFGVLRHGADGFLSEGGFHTYQPERHRKMNRDYCRQFGVRYSRAIRDWFGDNTETQGHIMGSIKDRSLSMRHSLYNFRVLSTDEHYPLNKATVILQTTAGVELARYTTDDYWNGIFVFPRLNPGTYRLVFEPITFTPVHSTDDGVVRSYDREIREIEVKANATAFINFTFGDEPDPVVFCDMYPQPKQDGGIAAASAYEFEQVGTAINIDPLVGLTIRRTLMHDGKMYVLAVDVNRNPRLMIINPETGALLKEMNTIGLDLTNHAPNISDNTTTWVPGANPRIFALSDIAFTADGVLIGVNSTIVGNVGNQFLTGAPFNVYVWDNDDAAPRVLTRYTTGETLAIVGNNNSNFVGNSIAVQGCFDNFKLYFTSHPGPGWTMSNFHINLIAWHIEDGNRVAYMRNDLITASAPRYTIAVGDGANLQLTASPTSSDHVILSPTTIITAGTALAPTATRAASYTEVAFQWAGGITGTIPAYTEFSGSIPQTARGANFFRYATSMLMAVPVAEQAAGPVTNYKALLFDVTRGINNARLIGETEVGFNTTTLAPMAAHGVVRNADIDLYLIAGNSRIAKFETVGYTSGTTRVFAYNLVSNYNATLGGYDLSFELNYDATSVELLLTNLGSGSVAKVIPLGSFAKGVHQTTLLNADIPVNPAGFNWAIRARADNVARFVRISDPADARYSIFAPRSVAMDKSPESPFFGRLYVTAQNEGAVAGRNTQRGVYVLSPVGVDVTGQGDAAHAGGMTWDGTLSFRKAAVASDGRIFIADGSINNSGIYVMDPETFEMNQMFTGTRDASGRFFVDGTAAANYVGGRTNSVGIRGTGANTQLFAIVNHNDPANTWTQLSRRYDIGAGATTWSGNASWQPTAGNGTANGNNSIQPVAGGFWAAQFRGNSHEAANPVLHFFSETRNARTWSSTDALVAWGFPAVSSANGGMAVYEPEGLIALSYNNGIQFFSYKLTADMNGVPEVAPLFFFSLGAAIEDIEFDYAGNLYVASVARNEVSVFGMPTGNNEKITPARTNLVIARDGNVNTAYSAAICEGETFSDENFTNLSTAGDHVVVQENVLGGNKNTITLTLTVNPKELLEYNATIEEGQTYQDEYFTIVNVTMADNKIHELITVTVHGCEKTVRLNLTVTPAVSIEIVNLQEAVRIYPNPARNELNIATTENLTIKTLSVFDLAGRTVNNPTGLSQIDVSNLSQGVYFIRIETDKGTVTKRFIKE